MRFVDGGPPKVGDVDVTALGAKSPIDSASEGQTAYVPRDGDEVPARLVADGGTVVLRGPAAGKSSVAAEAVRRCHPGRALIVPVHAGDLRAFLDGGRSSTAGGAGLDAGAGHLGARAVAAGR